MPFRFDQARIELVGHCRQIEQLIRQRDEDQLVLIKRCQHLNSVATKVHCQDRSSQELCLDCGFHVRYQSRFPNPRQVDFEEFKNIKEGLGIPVVVLTTDVYYALEKLPDGSEAEQGTSAG